MKRIAWGLLGLLLSFGSSGVAFATTYFSEDFSSQTLGAMTAVSLASNADWGYDSYGGDDFARINGYGADVASDDWLLTPEIPLPVGSDAKLTFTTIKGYDGPPLQVRISTDYDGPGTAEAIEAANWSPLSGTLPDTTANWSDPTASGPIDLSAYAGENVTVAFQYTSTGTGSGEAAGWEVLDIRVADSSPAPSVAASVDESSVLTETLVTFSAKITGGAAPFEAVWQFSDGRTLTGAEAQRRFVNPGEYSATVTVKDAENREVTSAPVAVTVMVPETYTVPDPVGTLRVATFNTYLNRNEEGELAADLAAGDAQAAAVAEIIQRVRPDVILLNEFDYDASGEALDLFQRDYLAIGQNGAPSIQYPYHYIAPVNTGVPSGKDFDNDGAIGGPDDAYGFGDFPGQYGMAVLSMYPIETDRLRTFQTFLWQDMPEAMLPTYPDGSPYYSADELAVFRLSSKSHWDVPVDVDGKTLHLLASHPTPPVFDDGTLGVDQDVVDWNGTRNHDEIRFWADYVDPEKSGYIYDDSGRAGGLPAETRFVILGDLNADPVEGDSTAQAILQMLDHPRIQDPEPTSVGATENTGARFESTPDDTIEDGMRLDYVLPSVFGVTAEQGRVFWPGRNYDLSRLTGFQDVISSDHRLVWEDLTLTVAATDDGQADTQETAVSGGDGGSGALGPWTLALLVSLLLGGRLARRRG
jgi:hypothetical protein